MTYNTPIKTPLAASKSGHAIIRYCELKVQQKETFNPAEIPKHGRILALDPGMRRIGLAISDESRVIATPLPVIERRSWKKLLSRVAEVIGQYDAVALVVGLPLNTDGSESPMSVEARRLSEKFRLSLSVPVFLQDERVTTYEARRRLWDRGVAVEQLPGLVDSEAAAVILGDFLQQIG